RVELFCRDDGKSWSVSYPDRVKIERIRPEHSYSQRNFLSFCRRAMRRGNASATAFVGHDMHGLIPARLLARRHARPLLYHCYDYSGNGYTHSFGTRLLKRMHNGFARNARLVTVPDEGLAQVLLRELGLSRPPVVMVNSPLETPSHGGALRRLLKERGYDF